MDKSKVEKFIKQVIFKFLNSQDYRVFIFGSRATGKARKFSDFDVGIIGKKPVPRKILGSIEETFEESDLPFHIDVVDFSRTAKKFQQVALSTIKEL